MKVDIESDSIHNVACKDYFEQQILGILDLSGFQETIGQSATGIPIWKEAHLLHGLHQITVFRDPIVATEQVEKHIVRDQNRVAALSVMPPRSCYPYKERK